VPRPYKIFISSPGDVKDERLRAALVISRLKREFARFYEIEPVLWEYEPMLSSGHFQDVIDPPSEADTLVLILWSRLGTPLPPRTALREYKGLDGRVPVTGTEWEYEQALEASKARGGVPNLLVYRSFDKARAEYDRIEDLEQMRLQWEALQDFWGRYFKAGDGSFKVGFNRFSGLDEFEAQLERHLRELLRRELPKLPGRSAGDRIDWWEGSPYRGLKAFDIEQAPVFFGRAVAERAVTEALVRSAGEGSAFALVLGASGSGKSSLVRAGLLPDLKAPGVVSGVVAWRHVIIQPAELTPDPFAALATLLLEPAALPELAAIGYRADEIATQLRGGAAQILPSLRLALERAAARPKDAGTGGQGRLILVLDQFEVLLTSASFTAETRAALDLLFSDLAKSGLVWIIVTLRSDFYQRMVDVPLLNGLAAGHGQYLLAAPGSPEIEQIIQRPAEVSGLHFEVDDKSGIALDSVIRDAAARDPASLPLLSFVLDELYRLDVETKHRDVLSYDSYRQLGELEGAIARHAETMVEKLSPELNAALPALLLALVEIDEIKGTVTARTVRQANLADPRQAELAARLEAERLAVADDKGAGKILRLAHEALLVKWPLLADLIAEHRDFLIIRRRLLADATAWEGKQRDKDFLLPAGRRLAEAEEVLSQRRSELDPEIIEFAEVSIAAERARVAAEQRAKEEALRRELARSRRIAAIVFVLFLLAVAAGGYAWREQGVATTALGQAEKDYQLALDQATGSIGLLVEGYDRGSISTTLLQQLMAKAQQTVGGLPGETNELTAARAELLNVISLANVSVGLAAKARDSAERAKALAQQLLAANPTNPAWRRDRAIAEERLAEALYWQGALDAALVQARAGQTELIELAGGKTDDQDLLWEIILADERIGDDLRAQGKLADAASAYQVWLDEAQKLMKLQPQNQRWQRALGFAYQRLGDNLLIQNKPAAAADEFRLYLDRMTKLSAADPQSAAYLEGLAFAHQRLGDSLMARNDADGALAHYRAYQESATQLAAIDPSNFRWQELVEFSHQRIGEALLNKKAYAVALDEFRAYLSIAARVNAKDPDNGSSLYDLANAHEKVGDALREAGSLPQALLEYQAELQLAVKLAAKDATNATWQKNLATSNQRVGLVLRLQGNVAGALAAFVKCAAIPTKSTAWTPRSTWPADVNIYCKQQIAELAAAPPPRNTK
jgi:Novel STAND NTPase 1